MKKNLTSLLVIFWGVGFSQNLVPNFSFEDTLPHGGYCYTQINVANHWFNPNAATPDLYSYSPGSANCTYSSLNNPSGYQLPRTGFAYAGIYTWSGATREYIAVKLDSSLSNGCSYYVEFYVSRADTFGLATDKMGCVFVNDTTGFYLNNAGYLPFLTAIQSAPGVLIADDTNWIKISGVYTAQGGEHYLIIGNFHDVANTYVDTVATAMYYSAYYYVDDVKVLSCDSTIAMGIGHTPDEFISVYPNPASNLISLNYSFMENIDYVELYSTTGELLVKEKWRWRENQNTISVSKIPNGTYILKIRFTNKINYFIKIIIIHQN